MTLIDRACYERGCACYDSRVDRDGVEVVQRKWVGLSNGEMIDLSEMELGRWDLILEVEAKLQEKNT